MYRCADDGVDIDAQDNSGQTVRRPPQHQTPNGVAMEERLWEVSTIGASAELILLSKHI
jgi:hypothetical protein